MTPTVGRIVHFYLTKEAVLAEQPYAAIITRVWSDDCVNLHVFNDGSQEPIVSDPTSATRSEEPEAHCWMWPPRA